MEGTHEKLVEMMPKREFRAHRLPLTAPVLTILVLALILPGCAGKQAATPAPKSVPTDEMVQVEPAEKETSSEEAEKVLTAPAEQNPGNMMRFIGAIIGNVNSEMNRLVEEHNINDEIDEVWLTSIYIARASHYPQIKESFTNLRRFSEATRAMMMSETWYRDLVAKAARVAGIECDDQMLDLARVTYLAQVDGPLASFELMERHSAASLSLHDYLLEVEETLSYDSEEDMVIWDSEEIWNKIEEKMDVVFSLEEEISADIETTEKKYGIVAD